MRSSVPLLRDLGLTVDWKVIGGDAGFLPRHQGAAQRAAGRATLIDRAPSGPPTCDCVQENAATLDGDYDFIVIHDPQPAGLLQAHGKGSARWVWRCHIDTSEPNPDAWSFLEPLLAEFDAAVFTMPEFVPPDFPVARVEAIAPAIDPLSPKNIDIDPATASQILDWIGLDLPGTARDAGLAL